MAFVASKKPKGRQFSQVQGRVAMDGMGWDGERLAMSASELSSPWETVLDNVSLLHLCSPIHPFPLVPCVSLCPTDISKPSKRALSSVHAGRGIVNKPSRPLFCNFCFLLHQAQLSLLGPPSSKVEVKERKEKGKAKRSRAEQGKVECTG